MIRSMTGYGRGEAADERRRLICEIKSVNNRYLDFNIRMPRKYNPFDAEIRAWLKKDIARGKVDVFISEETEGSAVGELVCNYELAGAYVAAMRKMGETFGIEDDVTVSRISHFPEVFSLREPESDEEALKALLKQAVTAAIAAYNEARGAEGTRLTADILDKLEVMRRNTEEIKAHEDEIMAAYRTRLMDKVHEVLENHELDEAQIASALVIYADKISTDEETVRLLSHIEQMKNVLGGDGSVGRQLDFLTQEMNRESNTILSKAGDLATSNIGIALKTDVEKIREQIQNIE